MREDYIHFYVRQALKEAGWTLIAGQYPNGSDDELPCLNVIDPVLARDNSPDHRRHSMNKLVPDLVAAKAQNILVVEMKPAYDSGDEDKLMNLLTERRAHFVFCLSTLLQKRGLKLEGDIYAMRIIPCLGFSRPKRYPRKAGFTYFYVNDDRVVFDGNGILSAI